MLCLSYTLQRLPPDSSQRIEILSKFSRQKLEPKLLNYQGTAGAEALRFWQLDLMEATPEGTAVEAWAVRAHQRVADRLVDRFSALKHSPFAGELPSAILLPCLYCAVVFDSNGGRSRKCGSCRHAKPYVPRALRPDTPLGKKLHVTGARPWQVGSGDYLTGPDALDVIWRVECQHPGCETTFDAIAPHERYCDRHKRQRH